MFDTPIRKVKQKLITETRSVLVMALYVWVVLVLLQLHKLIVLRQYGLSAEVGYKVGFTLFNALLLSKFMMIAEAMQVGEGLKDKPVFYTIAFKSAMYAAVLIVFDFMEEVLVGVLHGKSFVQSIPMLGGGGAEGILLVGLIAFVALLPWFAYREVDRAMSEGELKKLMRRRRTGADTQPIRRAG